MNHPDFSHDAEAPRPGHQPPSPYGPPPYAPPGYGPQVPPHYGGPYAPHPQQYGPTHSQPHPQQYGQPGVPPVYGQIPYGQPYGLPYHPPYGPDHYGPDQPHPLNNAAMRLVIPIGTSPWAIAAGYLGLFSLMVVPGPVAIGAGIMAIRDIRKNKDVHGMPRAIFGIVMGSIATLFLLFFVGAAVTEVISKS